MEEETGDQGEPNCLKICSRINCMLYNDTLHAKSDMKCSKKKHSDGDVQMVYTRLACDFPERRNALARNGHTWRCMSELDGEDFLFVLFVEDLRVEEELGAGVERGHRVFWGQEGERCTGEGRREVARRKQGLIGRRLWRLLLELELLVGEWERRSACLLDGGEGEDGGDGLFDGDVEALLLAGRGLDCGQQRIQ